MPDPHLRSEHAVFAGLAADQRHTICVSYLQQADEASAIRGVCQAERLCAALCTSKLAACDQVKFLNASSTSLHMP